MLGVEGPSHFGGHCYPWAGGPVMYKEANWASQEAVLLHGLCFSSWLHLPFLAFLYDGLKAWSWKKPLSLQVAFGPCFSSLKNVVLDGFILCVGFAYMYACVPWACWCPWRSEELIGSLGLVLQMVDSGLLYGCWEWTQVLCRSNRYF